MNAAISPEPARRILVVDDEPMVREVVADYLRHDGYQVDIAEDGRTAVRLAHSRHPHLIVLDLMLPGASGLEVLEAVRRSSDVPVIVLTARGDEGDRVLGLELGADDYVVKPFSPRELLARVHSVLRRAEPGRPGERMEADGLVVDPGTREVLVDGESVELTAREFELLTFLMRHPRQVFTRAQLLEEVWDSSADWQDPATVTVHVGRMRQKLETSRRPLGWVETVRGVGYRFQP